MDVSNWLRPDAPTSEDRLFCHVYGWGDHKTDQFVPGRQSAVNQDSCANGSSE
ncbi:hypothetical protein [Streptomyces sp. 5-10]|uniref:hypothetical protein n=1 Tax=Streptomyces sp. 5-10 TaxID=878925 RepID=UPI001CC2BA41|nr:hypothetical protein [Streptomyces sp. 5-10]